MYRFSVFFSLFCAAYSHKERIHNGTAVAKGVYPYQVELRSSINLTPICGGSIINNFYVLTAGHCVHDIMLLPPRLFEVMVGASRRNDSTMRYYSVAKFFIHKNYRHYTVPHEYCINDVALILVDGPIKFTPFISPVKLPTLGYHVKKNTQVTATGWGRLSESSTRPSYYLRAVNLTVVENKICKARWADKVINIDDRMICVAGSVKEYGQAQNDAGGCYGDSGGPVVENNVLIGIMSSGNSCSDSYRYPHILMNVSNYVPWIKKHSKVEVSFWQRTKDFFKNLFYS